MFLLFTKWSEILKWILLTTDKFPKKARFTFSTRIDNLALDIIELIIEARYLPQSRQNNFKNINIKLEKLRIFFRFAYELKFISLKQYEFITREINETGAMIGGWLKINKIRDPETSSG